MPGTITREQLVTSILDFLSHQDLLSRAQIRTALEREVDAAGANALTALKEHLEADTGWSYYPPDRLAAQIHYLLADHFLQPDSQISGGDAVAMVGAEPALVFANHLSYADANVLQVLLQRAGCDTLASRLTAVAGPKVFSSRERRFSSLCFGTIKVPQSADVSSEEAVLTTREVARAARLAISVAAERVAAGDALVLFGEGTRSRMAHMQRLLPGVARYLEAAPDAWVLPAGIVGTEVLFPVGDATVSPASVHLRFGAPLRATRLITSSNGHRQTLVDAVGLMIAELLPQSYTGVYERPDDFPDAAAVLWDARKRD